MNWRFILAYVERDLRIVFSDKIAIFWMIAWPLIWILMVAYIFIPPGPGSPVCLSVGVVNYDINPPEGLGFTSYDFIQVLETIEYNGKKIFKVTNYENETILRENLKKGRVDIGIVIPRGFSNNLTHGSADLKVLIGAKDPYSGSINQYVMSGFLNEFNQRTSIIKVNYTLKYIEYGLSYANYTSFSREEFINAIKTYLMGLVKPVNATFEEVKPEALISRERGIGWYIIGAVGMMFLYTGFSHGASVLLSERERGSLKRIIASPVRDYELIVAIIFSSIAIQSISGAIAIFFGILLTGAELVFNIYNPVHWLVPLLIITGALMSNGLGIMLSTLAKTSSGASGLGTALGLLFSFTAGVWFPKTWLPQWLRVLSEVFPPTWVFDTARSILVFNYEFSEIWFNLVKIAIAVVVILAIDMLIYKHSLRKYIEQT